jgi:hypothetical protein
MVQVHVPARVWGFESLLRHHVKFKHSVELGKTSPAIVWRGALLQ